MADAPDAAHRILIVAPTGADATNMAAVLIAARLQTRICPDLADAAAQMREGAGALLLTEEALPAPQREHLVAALNGQPEWSDIPIILIASSSQLHWWTTSAAVILGTGGNFTFLERPLKAAMLVAAAKGVLRARGRQYQVRDLLAERNDLLHTLESRVVERTARLQELVTELEAFSYSVSHDLRAPLRVMAGYARTIEEDHEPTLIPEVKAYLQRIARTAERMDRLTQDVLAYTRVSRAEIALERIDLSATVRDVVDQYPMLAGVRCAIRIHEPLHDVIGHAPSLVQAIANLLDNAVKFVPSTRKPQIHVRTQQLGPRVRVLIEDNGTGIHPTDHAKIFGIFERVVGKDIPGTGMGLAIVKRAAERMGGSVGLTSEMGQGAQFWIELAAAPSNDQLPMAGAVDGSSQVVVPAAAP